MKCLECFIELKSNKALITHLRYHHKSITSKDYYNKFLKKNSKEGICQLCGKETNFLSISKGYSIFCSLKCSRNSENTKNKFKNTCMLKYGTDNPAKSRIAKQKYINTCRKKYGVDSTNQLEEIKDKRRKTCLSIYSVENPSQALEVKKKKEMTCIKNFGVKYSLQSKEIRDAIEKTNLERFGEKYACQSAYVKEKIINTHLKKRLPFIKKFLKNVGLEILDDYINNKESIKLRCLLCNTEFNSSYFNIQQGCGRCPKCYPKYKSVAELNIVEFIKNLGLEVVENSREVIKPYEIDIYIPSKKVAIEYNGLYWHSEIRGKDKYYHITKLNKCLEKDIRLIQIFEDEWAYTQDIVLNRLKQILSVSDKQRIHARKCKIEEIDSKVKNIFLEKYHIQGQDKASVKLGAFYRDELVAVMTFSKGNIAKGNRSLEGIWELNRFCSNYNYRIPGVASKLLTYFKRNYEWKEIFSYADRRWSVGNLYYLLGFSLEKNTEPNYWYTKGLKRIHRFNLRKKAEEPKDVPEYFLRLEEGYQRVWDCGHLKFVNHSVACGKL